MSGMAPLAVIVPGDDVAVSQGEDTDLNVVADHDGFDLFHLVIRHLDVFYVVITIFSTHSPFVQRLAV